MVAREETTWQLITPSVCVLVTPSLGFFFYRNSKGYD